MIGNDKEKTLWLSPLVLDEGFSVEFRDDHVHVQLGANMEVNAERRSAVWAKISNLCQQEGTKRVLVEGRLPEGVFQTSEVIDAGLKAATVPKLWMAFCFENQGQDELGELYETVAGSRGVRVKYFSNTNSALHWLRTNTPA